MKGRPVVVLAAVGPEVQQAYDYFAIRAPGKGEDFLERYFDVTDRIVQNPEAFPQKFDDYRRALVPKYGYAVYYFITDEKSVIVAVIHARRHPRLTRDFIRARRDTL
jgi:plasmid stabilization system protein ParE